MHHQQGPFFLIFFHAYVCCDFSCMVLGRELDWQGKLVQLLPTALGKNLLICGDILLSKEIKICYDIY